MQGHQLPVNTIRDGKLTADSRGNTALHRAACSSDEALRILLENIATEPNAKEILNQPNREGETALHLASQYGRFPAMSMLVNAGADILVHDNRGGTALDHMKRFSDSEQLDMLLWLADKLKDIADEATGKKEVYHYQQLDLDRLTLVNLASFLDKQLAGLYKTPKIPQRNEQLSVASPLFIMCVFAASAIWMITSPSHPDNRGHRYNNIIVTALSILAAYVVAVMAAILSYQYFSSRETRISGKQFLALQKMLQTDAIDKLKLLPADKRPAPEYEINILETGSRTLAATQPFSVATGNLISLRDTVNRIIGEMNVTQRTMTLFPRQVNMSADEIIPPLPGPLLHQKRGGEGVV